MALFGHLLRGEVELRGVEAEGSRDVDLAADLALPLGPGRTFRGYLEETYERGEERKQGKERRIGDEIKKETQSVECGFRLIFGTLNQEEDSFSSDSLLSISVQP